VSGSPSNLKALDVVFIASGGRHLTETNLECYFLAGIIVEIKTKGVKTLFPKSIGAAGPGLWIDGQGHCYCPRCSAKEIKIAKVDSRILSSGGRIKMVGHIRRSSDQRQLCSDIRRFERKNLTAFAAELFNIRADVAEIRRLRWKTEYLKRQRRCMLQQVRGFEAEQPKLAF
jgi:hypothetical protein